MAGKKKPAGMRHRKPMPKNKIKKDGTRKDGPGTWAQALGIPGPMVQAHGPGPNVTKSQKLHY